MPFTDEQVSRIAGNVKMGQPLMPQLQATPASHIETIGPAIQALQSVVKEETYAPKKEMGQSMIKVFKNIYSNEEIRHRLESLEQSPTPDLKAIERLKKQSDDLSNEMNQHILDAYRVWQDFFEIRGMPQ